MSWHGKYWLEQTGYDDDDERIETDAGDGSLAVMDEQRQFLEELFEEIGLETINWSGSTIRCHCPTCDRDDGIVYLDCRFPRVWCFKSGCQDEMRRISTEIRDRLIERYGEQGISLDPKTILHMATLKAQGREWRRWHATAKNRVLKPLLRLSPIHPAKWIEWSPYNTIDVRLEEQWRHFLLGLYRPRDIVWCGMPWQAGRHNLRTVREWLEEPDAPGSHVSACTFKERAQERLSVDDVSPDLDPGLLAKLTGDAQSYSRPELREVHYQDWGRRSGSWVDRKLFWVLESDAISPGMFGRVIHYLATGDDWMQRNAPLRAVVHSGNKSLHAWFDWPQSTWEELHAEHFRLHPARHLPCGPEPAKFEQVSEQAKRRHPEWLAWRKQQDTFERAYAAWANSRLAKRILIERERYDRMIRCRTAMARGLGCDPQLWHPSGTARLPGQWRWERESIEPVGVQRLLYFNPKFQIDL